MSDSESSTCSRRDFAQSLALSVGLGTAAATLPVSTAIAQEPEKEKPRLPAPPDLILASLVQQYPSEHYTEEILEGIVGDIRLDLARGRELSKFGLQNSDEPAFVFSAYRGDRPHGSQSKGQP